MLEIKCTECKCIMVVEGYTTSDSFMEPGEVVIEDDAIADAHEEDIADGDPGACEHLLNGGDYEITDESYESFPDDVF